jgi:beta-phosphoglucomutase-like phosphatase (HAD superfamily)
VTEGLSPSGRPIRTVIDPLRARIELDRFDAAILELETVVADLGYGDVRALSGSVSWIDRLREDGKRIALVDGGANGEAAIALAGLDDRFEVIAPTIADALEALEIEPARAVVVASSVQGIQNAREAGVYRAIGVVRGHATPEDLRRAGADGVLAELHELL